MYLFQTRNRIKAFSHLRSSGAENDQFYTGSLNLVPEVVNKRPNMGSYLHSNMDKNSNYRGLHRIKNLQQRQPRFLAWLPRWQ